MTQADIAKVKVTVYAWQKFVCGPLSFTGNLDGDDTSHSITGLLSMTKGLLLRLGHV